MLCGSVQMNCHRLPIAVGCGEYAANVQYPLTRGPPSYDLHRKLGRPFTSEYEATRIISARIKDMITTLILPEMKWRIVCSSTSYRTLVFHQS